MVVMPALGSPPCKSSERVFIAWVVCVVGSVGSTSDGFLGLWDENPPRRGPSGKCMPGFPYGDPLVILVVATSLPSRCPPGSSGPPGGGSHFPPGEGPLTPLGPLCLSGNPSGVDPCDPLDLWTPKTSRYIMYAA